MIGQFVRSLAFGMIAYLAVTSSCFAQPTSNPLEDHEKPKISTTNEGNEGRQITATKLLAQPQVKAEARAVSLRRYIHNSSAHFPIALFIVSAGSILLAYFTGVRAETFAFHCLVLGTLVSVPCVVTGWSSVRANEDGIWTLAPSDEISDALFYHAWIGTSIPILAIVITILAFNRRRGPSGVVRQYWHAGVMLIAVLIGWIAYLGGELTLGSTVYSRAFHILWPQQ